MRALMPVLFLVCGSAWAGESVAPSRFEIHAARVQTDPDGESKRSSGRFALAARLSKLDAEPDPYARYQAKTTLRAAGAICGAQGTNIFSDGFE